MKEGLRSGNLAAQLVKGNGPSSRVSGRRRGNEVINGGCLGREEKGLDSNNQRCPIVVESGSEANGESKENAVVPLPKEGVEIESECGEGVKPDRRGRKRGRKNGSECGEDGVADGKKVKESLECKVEVVGRVLRSKTIAMQASQMEKGGSEREVDDLGQSESSMAGQSDRGIAHCYKKRVKIEEDESDDGGSGKKLKGEQGMPVVVKRKRGRPRKEQRENKVLGRVVDKKEEANGSLQVKRKRGRPRKVQRENMPLEGVADKKAAASGSKKNMRVSKVEESVKPNGTSNHIGRESRRFSFNEKNPELAIQESVISSEARSKGDGDFEVKKKGRKAHSKRGEGKDGRATEKQLLREQIKAILMRAGWTVDYRPRRSKEYNDAVYVSPKGRGYWSVTLAYNVLKSQYENGDCEPDFTFTPVPEEVLEKLRRKTRKQKEEEMDLELGYGGGGEIKDCTIKGKSGSKKHAGENSRLKEKVHSVGRSGQKSSNWKMKGKSFPFVRAGTSHKGMLNRKLKGTQNRKRFALLARNSKEGLNADVDGYVPYTGKRTLLSWMIDVGTVPLNGKVQYMNGRKTRVLLEGRISRDGIRCGCCSEILTILKFETHAGAKLCSPFQNITLETGVSLLQCQLDTWNKQEESERNGFHLVDVGADDPNDDTCGICGDGGDLICCDGCPSTFHQSCLGIQKFPSGDWHCVYCSCKFCGMFSGVMNQTNSSHDVTSPALLTCQMCEQKYHHMCTESKDGELGDSSSCFCGNICKELSERLQMLLGVKHDLEEGFSWTFVKRSEVGSDISSNGMSQSVECNSKLAVALTIMDECFLPIVDQRSGINLIHNVLYNCGSNFNRLNYSGFLTAILERGDEIISAASIRIHGIKYAEMPFIGTRHIYRRQGMCRRLLNAIESGLCSLGVEKLVIPAIPELMQTWTSVFGFNPLEVSSRQEMRNMNMLVFHGTDMLQKPLLKDQFSEERMIPSAVLESTALGKDLDIKHGVANSTSPEGSDLNISCKGTNHTDGMSGEPADVESGSRLNEGSLNDSSDITSETTNAPESATDEKDLVNDNLEGENKMITNPQGSASDAHALKSHCATEEVDEHQTAIDDSTTILAPDEKAVESDSKLNQQSTCKVKNSCIGSEAMVCKKHNFQASVERKETTDCGLKNDGSSVKRSTDFLDDNNYPQHLDVDFSCGSLVSGKNVASHDLEVKNQLPDEAKDNNPQHLSVDFSHGSLVSGKNVASHDLEVKNQLPDEAKDNKYDDSQLLQATTCALDAGDKALNTFEAKDEVVVVENKPSARGEVYPMLANDSRAALLVGCNLESSRQGDGLESHELQSFAASVEISFQPCDATTEPNDHHQSSESAAGLDKNNVFRSETCAFTCPVGINHQPPCELTVDDVHDHEASVKPSEIGLSSLDDCSPPNSPQTITEPSKLSQPDSVAGHQSDTPNSESPSHSTSASGVALLCASGSCKAGGAPEVIVVSNRAS